VRTTLRGSPVVAAPGKLFLVGEYGVLDGGMAVVAAVSRLAVGEFIPALDPGSPLVAEAVRVTLAALGDKAVALPAGSVWIDTGAFAAQEDVDVEVVDAADTPRGGRRKLGLGSSAATAACAVGAILEMAGLPIAAHRDLAFSLAESAHRSWQGGVGSGADVAAAVYGGVLEYSRPAGGAPVVHRLPGVLDALELVVFSSRVASSTTSQIRTLRAFAESQPARHAALLAPVRQAAERFIESIASRRPRDTIAATRSAGEALAALGVGAEIPIVTPPFARAAALAAELGGAAKPSGAGGGDVGIALFAERAAAQAFIERAGAVRAGTAARAGGHDDLTVEILSLSIDQDGLHRRSPGIARVEQHV
jgi:phosphomevalonate kinase